MRKDLRKYLVLGAAPVAATVAGGLFFKDWVLHAISANIAMNMKILLSMAVGAALIPGVRISGW